NVGGRRAKWMTDADRTKYEHVHGGVRLGRRRVLLGSGECAGLACLVDVGCGGCLVVVAGYPVYSGHAGMLRRPRRCGMPRAHATPTPRTQSARTRLHLAYTLRGSRMRKLRRV